jgi:glutaredoxin
MTNQSQPLKPQQCTVSSLYVSWAVYLAGLAFLVSQRNWLGCLAWLVIVPWVKWLYLRLFPRVSRWIGYGRVYDKLPPSVTQAHVEVTYYSLLGCPFCPIVEQRLEALQKEMHFVLRKIDVTLRPQVLASKGIRSVPVVEVGGNRLVGNATTEQLAEFIAHVPSSELLHAS